VRAALLALGFEQEVGDTYRYALGRYVAAVTSRWSLPAGQLFDFPAYAPTALRSSSTVSPSSVTGRSSRDTGRSSSTRSSALPRWSSILEAAWSSGVLFSEAQDYAIRDSSCYSNCACHCCNEAWMLSRYPIRSLATTTAPDPRALLGR